MSRSILDFLSRKPFAVVGHRGAAGIKPENTISSIRYAVEQGVDVVEVDVRMTKDGTLILLHDDTFERLTGIPQSARNLDFNWIREHIRIQGEPIATLEEALTTIDGQCGLFIEIKEPDTIDKVMDTVMSYGAEKWVAISSFYEEPLVEAKRINNKIVTGIIYFKPPGKIIDARRINAKIVLPYYRLATPRAVSFAHRLGLKVVVWTINNIDDAREMVARGVNGIATDYPDKLVKLRDMY